MRLSLTILQRSWSSNFAGAGFDVLLVADAPINVLGSDHRFVSYSLVRLDVFGMPGNPFASLDFAMLGSAHVVVGLSCCGLITSDVVGSGWTDVTFVRAIGVGS